MRSAFGLVVVLTLVAACRPDVPGRGCTSPDDCFRQELCADGTCVTRPKAPPSAGPAEDAAVASPTDAAAAADGANASDVAVPGGDASVPAGDATPSDAAADAVASDARP
jgi:hypothetical protein